MHSKIFIVICTILSNCLLAQTNLPDKPVNYPKWESPKIDKHLSDKSNQQKPKKESDPFADYINDQISADKKKEIERNNELFESAAPKIEYKPETFKQRSYSTQDALEFMKSPCWSKIGYNPELSKEIMRDMYKHCESQIQEKESRKIVSIVLGILFFSLITAGVFYFLNTNKRNWRKLKERIDTDFQFKLVIEEMFIKDNISFKKYFYNKQVFEMKHSLPTSTPTYSMKTFLMDDNFEKPNFPEWFFFAYPDVTVWYKKSQNAANDNVLSSMSNGEELRNFLKQLVAKFKGPSIKLEVV